MRDYYVESRGLGLPVCCVCGDEEHGARVVILHDGRARLVCDPMRVVRDDDDDEEGISDETISAADDR